MSEFAVRSTAPRAGFWLGCVFSALLCAAILDVVQIVGFTWMMGNFHPGNDVEVPADIERRAQIGMMLVGHFAAPSLWLHSLSCP